MKFIIRQRPLQIIQAMAIQMIIILLNVLAELASQGVEEDTCDNDDDTYSSDSDL